MKKIICLVITLLMTLPVYAKLTAHEEARINAMLEGLDLPLYFQTPVIT